MICKPYPHLGECVYEKVLPNGLLIRVVPKKGFAKTHAFFAVNYGSIDQDFILNGVVFAKNRQEEAVEKAVELSETKKTGFEQADPKKSKTKASKGE